jgi:steroid 5-alpha reductase family enzyme
LTASLGVCINSKLGFYHYVDTIFSQSIVLLGLVNPITFSFSSIQHLLLLFVTVIWSSVTVALMVVSWNAVGESLQLCVFPHAHYISLYFI